MKFRFIKDYSQDDFQYLHYSENDVVAIWIQPMMYGSRVRMECVKFLDVGYSYEFCAGANQENLENIFSMVKSILEQHDESEFNSSNDFHKIFPIEGMRPTRPGLPAYEQLKELAGDFEVDENVPNESSIRLQSILKSGIGIDLMNKLLSNED